MAERHGGKKTQLSGTQAGTRVYAYPALTVILAIFCAGTCSPHNANRSRDTEPYAFLAGSWQGTAFHTADWCPAESLTVTLTVRASGMVTGTIGDAVLVKTSVLPKEGWFFRLVPTRKTVRIKRGIVGSLVAGQDVFRSAVSIRCRAKNETLSGDIRTSGTSGTKDAVMEPTASFLVYRKMADGE